MEKRKIVHAVVLGVAIAGLAAMVGCGIWHRSVTCSEGWPLVEKGVARAVVVRNTEGGAVMALAVIELLDHIEKMTGVRLPEADAETWDRAAGQAAIVVGRGALLDELGVDLGELPWEGYRMLTLPERRVFVLAGRDRGNPWGTKHPRNLVQEFGTLYAVYDLLEHWGVRWLFPGARGTIVPKCATLEAPIMDRVDGPDFRRRNLWTDAEEPREKFRERDSTQRAARLWALRCRAGNSMDEYATGHHKPKWWDLWAESHPEYLGLFRGRRGLSVKPQRSKLCVSNSNVAEAVAELAIAALRNGARSYSICEQDGSAGYCTCEKCSALDAIRVGEIPYKDQACTWRQVLTIAPLTDRYVLFWNRVAECVAAALPETPDRYLGVYLYSFYNDPPRGTQRLHPRLQATYVNNGQIEPSELRRRLEGWSRLTPHPLSLYLPPMFGAWPLWEFGEVTLPVFTLGNVHEGMMFCRELRIAGIQGNPNFTANNIGSHGLMAYALARWLWDADRTPEDILKDFTEHAFGSAANTMRQYFQTIEERQNLFPLPFVPREGAGEVNWLTHHLNVFEPSFVTQLLGLLDHALVQAQTEADRERVQLFRQNLVFTSAEVELERIWRAVEDPALSAQRPRIEGLCLIPESMPIPHGRVSMKEVLVAYRTCEDLYAGLWPENKSARPLFQRGEAARAVAKQRVGIQPSEVLPAAEWVE